MMRPAFISHVLIQIKVNIIQHVCVTPKPPNESIVWYATLNKDSLASGGETIRGAAQ